MVSRDNETGLMHGFFARTDVVVVGPLVLWFVLLCVKHVLADFIWQPHWMAVGKDQPSGWLQPLLGHCLIHWACMTALLLALQPRFWSLGLVDFCIHLTIDRCKGYFSAKNGWTPAHRPFWTVLGIDQTLHHLTGFMFAVVLAAKAS